MVDGRGVNGHWWVFAAPLTDREFVLRVVDVETGAVSSYSSAASSRTSLFDTMAFPDSGGYALRITPERNDSQAGSAHALRLGSAALPSCSANTTTLCLIEARFEISVDWEPLTGGGFSSAMVSSELQTSHTGAFYFAGPTALDVVAKVVETPMSFVVNLGTLSDAAFEVTVEDTCTGTIQVYSNPAGQSTNFVDDTSFPNVDCVP
jgi:hypothetical protein